MNNLLLTIEVTGKCNLRCLHCLRDRTGKPKDLPFSLFRKILWQALKYRKPYIALTGGEPTIHKGFFKMLDLLGKEGFSYHFVTNGTTFGKLYKKILPCMKKGLSRVCFSLDGASERTHERIRGKGTYRKALEAIAICKAKRIPFTVQMVVNRLNRHELEDMARLASKMGFEKLYFCHMQPAFGNITYNISLPPKEWLKVEDEIKELSSTFSVPIEISAGYFDETPIGHCQFMQGGALNVDYNGNLTFCCQMSNLFDSSKKKDIICSLKNTSLAEGHKKLIDMTARLNKKRINALQKGKLSWLDNFHCWFCFKEFSKVDWMRSLKDCPWTEDPYFKKFRRRGIP